MDEKPSPKGGVCVEMVQKPRGWQFSLFAGSWVKPMVVWTVLGLMGFAVKVAMVMYAVRELGFAR